MTLQYCLIYPRIFMSGMISFIACNRAIYSASVIDRTISVCNLVAHINGQFA